MTTTITPVTREMVHGAVDVEVTARGVIPHRLPGWVRARHDDPQLTMAESQPAGVRLVFRTGATAIGLRSVRTLVAYAGTPDRPAGVFDLLVDGALTAQVDSTGGRRLTVDLRTGARTRTEEPPGEIRFPELPAGVKDIEIWLPHTETVELLDITSNGPLLPAAVDHRPRWVHHGSSISHGSNAASPSTTWPALVAATADLSLTNLGMGGSALLDPFMARTVADLPANLVSVKIGINLVNTDLMRLRAFGPAVHGFLDTIRDAHPDIPLLVVSPVWCPIHEDTPGPGAVDPASWTGPQVRFIATGDPAEVAAGKLTLSVIRTHLAAIVDQRRHTDQQLLYVDGRTLYGATDHASDPLPDGLHPSPTAHRHIAGRFASVLAQNGGVPPRRG